MFVPRLIRGFVSFVWEISQDLSQPLEIYMDGIILRVSRTMEQWEGNLT